MYEKMSIDRIPGTETCEWHPCKEGQNFESERILPQGICPFLYHTVYPYFLGLLYGAKFDWNEYGDCNVCCPAADGIDVFVRKRDNDGSFDNRIGGDMDFVIFAEVVKVNGDCPCKHTVGQRFVFPTCMKKHYFCPAGFNNIFPLMDVDVPACIDKSKLRCPDWNNIIEYNIEQKVEK